jgi:hypothetical protein
VHADAKVTPVHRYQKIAKSLVLYFFGFRYRSGQIHPGEDSQELVAADAADKIVRPHTRLQLLADCSKELVAAEMAMCVIDGFEVIKVEENHGKRRAVLEKLFDRRFGSPSISNSG